MTRNVVLQFTDFDFNKADMVFINRHVHPQYAPKAAEINQTLRNWLSYRAMEKSMSVYYDVRSMQENDSTKELIETGIITVDGDDVLTITFSKVLVEDVVDVGQPPSHDAMLEMIDAEIERHHVATNGRDKNIMHPLRPMLRDLLTSITAFSINATTSRWAFVTHEFNSYCNLVTVEIHTPVLHTN